MRALRATIKKMRAAGRGTYVCERCQPRPRRPAARSPQPAAVRRRAGLQRAVAVGLEQLAEAADRALAHDDLRERHLTGP